ncbi:MAG: PAS domain-containing sensor histidine kinase [Sphingomonadales bacterium]
MTYQKRGSASGLDSIRDLPGVVVVLNRIGAILEINTDASRYIGMARLRSPDPFLGVVHADDRAMVRSRLEDVARHGRTRTRFRIQRNDGVYRWFEGQMNHFQTPGGDNAVILNALDMTPYHDRETQLRSMIEGSLQGMVLHRGGPPLFCNSAMARMVGFESPDDVLREPTILPYLHAEDRGEVMENVKARLAGLDAPTEYEFRLVPRNGAVIWVDCRASVVEWGGAPAILAACFDITARKKAEADRRASAALFSRVFEASPDCLTLTRLESSEFINVNNGFLESFGYEREELIGKSGIALNIWTDPDDRHELARRLEEAGEVHNFESRGRAKNGREIELLISAELIEFDGDKLILMAARDISERKAYEAELRSNQEAADLANRSKSEFLANMSHELRTPLNAILGFSDIIRNQMHGTIPEQKYVEYARDIYESGTHLLEIINDILDLSKIEAGRLEVQESEVCVPEVVTSCTRLIEPRAMEAGLIMKTAVSLDVPLLLADERLMKQILLNLLSNAVKFTPRGGMITVETDVEEDGSLKIVVQDTGIGMDEEGISRSMEPFGQVDTSFSRKHQGSGLGLPLVAAFTERQGGAFALQSRFGEGTRATICFPASRLATALTSE